MDGTAPQQTEFDDLSASQSYPGVPHRVRGDAPLLPQERLPNLGTRAQILAGAGHGDLADLEVVDRPSVARRVASTGTRGLASWFFRALYLALWSSSETTNLPSSPNFAAFGQYAHGSASRWTMLGPSCSRR